MTLNALPVGARAVVAEIAADQTERDRLAQLGLLQGVSLRCTLRGAGGSPTAFEIQGVAVKIIKNV